MTIAPRPITSPVQSRVSDFRPSLSLSTATELRVDAVKALLHILREFVNPETTDFPATGSQLGISQPIGDFSLAIGVRVPTPTVNFDVELHAIGVESKIQIARADWILGNRLMSAPAHGNVEPSFPIAVEFRRAIGRPGRRRVLGERFYVTNAANSGIGEVADNDAKRPSAAHSNIQAPTFLLKKCPG